MGAPIIWPPRPPPDFWLADAPASLRALEAKREAVGLRNLSQTEFLTYHRERGLRDFYFFAKYIGACPDLSPEFHAPLAYAWQRPNDARYGRVRMALVARSHLKTSLCTMAYALWRLANNPEERILLYMANQTLARTKLRFIREMLEGTGLYGKFFRACYPTLLPPDDERAKWTETQLIVRRKGNYPDPSLFASGPGSGVTGFHFTLELVDDIIDEMLNQDQMKKLCSEYDNLTPLWASMRDGERRIVGTHWNFFDVYHYAMKRHPNALVMRVPWRVRGQLVYAKCDVEEALSMQRSNPVFFSMQYELDPKDDAKQGFRRAWFRYHRRVGQRLQLLDPTTSQPVEEIDLALCNVFMFVDPNTGDPPNVTPGGAAAARREQDYVGVIVLAVDDRNRRHVLDAIRARWSTEECVSETFRLVDYWRPQWVAYEQVAAQRLFNHIFAMHFRQGRAPFQLIPWKGGRTSKNERIRGLIDYYANAMISHPEVRASDGVMGRVHTGVIALEGELTEFPFSEYDDLSDALSAHIPLAVPPGRIDPARAKAMSDKERDYARLDPASARVARWLDAADARAETPPATLGPAFWSEGLTEEGDATTGTLH